MIRNLGTKLEPPLLDPKTVRKAVKEGVSFRSFNKIKGMLESVASPEMHDYLTAPYLAPWMATTLHNNGLAWLCLVRGYHLWFFQVDQPKKFTEQFIK